MALEGNTMSYTHRRALVRSQASAQAQAQTLARNAAQDSAIGAALGLLLVSGLVASNLDMRQMMLDSAAPLSSLATLVSVVVAQCAVAASLCGAAVRKFSSLD